MACAGSLTSMVMTAGGSFLTNGGFSSVFGAAPISSLSTFSSISDVIAQGTTILNDIVPVSMGSAFDTVSAFSSISDQSWFGDLTSTLTEMSDAVIDFTGPMKDAWNTMSTAVPGSDVFLQTTGIFGPTTSQFLESVTTGSFNTALNQSLTFAGKALGGSGELIGGVITGNPSKLGTIFSSAQSYSTIANQFINAAQNSTDYLTKTFVSLDNTITGGVDGVSTWFDGLSGDISKLGNTVDWSNLSNLGSPGQLIANLENSGTLGPLYSKMANITVDDRTIQDLGLNVVASGLRNITGQQNITLGNLGIDLNNLAKQGASIPASVQKQIYEQLGTLTPTEVSQVKSILGNTQNIITNGQDLLDPKKLLASSFTTLTTPVRTASVGFRAIYENSSGSVNPQLDNLGENLKGIIPDDIAVSNAALARSLQQIKGIQETGTDQFADTVANLETLKDLPLLQDQTDYLAPGVADWWKNYYGLDYDIKLGTGNLDTIVLSDVIGFIAGYNSTQPLKENSTLMQQLADEGALDEFTRAGGIYQVIQEFSQGLYGPTENPPTSGTWEIVVPFGYFKAGTYTYASSDEAWEDFWIDELVPAIVQENINLVQNYEKAQTVYLNDTIWQEQIGREYLNRQRIDLLDTSTIPESDLTAINFAQNLPEIGKDTSFGGPAMWLERVVDATSLGGQATVGAMREGRNLARLAEAGIQQDAPIPTEGIETPGVFVPSTYNEEEANARVIQS